MGSLLTVQGRVFPVVRFGFDHIWRSVLSSWFSSESGNQSGSVSQFIARLLCTGCRLSGSLGSPWLICPGFFAQLLVPRLWAVRVSLGFPLICLVPLPWLWVVLWLPLLGLWAWLSLG